MNRVNSYTWIKLLIIVVSAFWMLSCSSESSAPLNKAFHNTTAHYNAYYISQEKIRQVEKSIWGALKPDYNHILRIFPPLDSTMATTYKSELEDCIKKASIVIQYHKNSKWVDDSYNLIGQARMYGYDFPNAVTTFKYVNTKGEDVDARHWAIVNLMRTFIENREYANAEEASAYLESEILNKKNLKYLYLTRAYYYQVIDDKDNMVRNLVMADPLLNKKEQARHYFIIGQIYQEIGFNSAAYEYYKKCISSNPEYELAFYAKLNIAQVTDLSDSKDLKKVRKYFKKLVNDEKNIEFQDRIYYEWGKFELKQNFLDEAISKFNLSVRNSISDQRQKGVSYISLGEIYYDTLANYPLAQAYYDSAVSVLPKTYEHYATVKQRAEVLNDFIKQINTISLQDSLLRLSNMDSIAVMDLFIAEATKNKEKAEEEAKEAERMDRVSTSRISVFDQPTGVGNSSWYFSNPSAVSSGKMAFQQLWGNRELEDHWRRSIKESVANIQTVEEDIADTLNTTDNNAVELSRDEIIMADAMKMYKLLPLTDEAKVEAHKKLEQAYYSLGKIYYFDLNEKDNAVTTFLKFNSQYPESEYSPEVYYLLYLVYRETGQEANAKQVSDFMHSENPNSIYTKLIDNPDYEELSNQANEILSKKYSDIYALYLDNKMDTAYQIIDNLLAAYPDVKFSANLKILQILIVGKTQPLADYQLALNAFLEEYPDHELNAYAKTLLDASYSYKGNLVKLKAAEYFHSTTDKYFYVVQTKPDTTLENAKIKLQDLISDSFKNQNLEIGNLDFNDSTQLVLVQSFGSMNDALLFFDMVKAEQFFDESLYPNFVITESNFDILYKSKEIEAYLEFYKEHF